MAKGALLGLVFGVLLGAAGVRFVDSRQGARLEDLGVKAGEAAGQTVSSREKQSVDLNAMVKTQKRLGETLRLTEAQAKALKNWGTVYGINLDGGAK